MTNAEAEILATTYLDKVKVYRPYKQVIDGETTFKTGVNGQLIYDDIPCALSLTSTRPAYKNDIDVQVNAEFSVFVRPDIEICANDTLIVNRLGMEYILLAGLADRQPSHNRIPADRTAKRA